jgi:protein O-GlcNAc transferase
MSLGGALRAMASRLRGVAPSGAASGSSGGAAAGSAAQAAALLRAGQLASSRAMLEGLLAANPEDAEAMGVLGLVAIEQRLPAEACLLAERMERLNPHSPMVLALAADLMRKGGSVTTALALAGRAVAADPTCVPGWSVIGDAHEALGRLDLAAQAVRRLVALRPDDPAVQQLLLFLLNRSEYASPQEIADEHRHWGERFADPLTRAASPHGNDADPDRRIRVGYVSADFRTHALQRLIEPVLECHDRDAFFIACYSAWPRPDAVTARLAGKVDLFREVAGLDDQALAARIRADAIDVVIDLSGHTRGNRLLALARKPAPVQATWLGYLGTTGMRAFDYRVVDGYTDPPGSEPLSVETLARLPSILCVWRAPEGVPAPSPAPCIRNGHVTFGSFNGYLKLSDATLRLWGRILARVPGARLRLVGAERGEGLDRAFELLEAEGCYADRVDVVSRVPLEEYYAQFAHADLALDPFPYNGGTTTCDTLWMGVPVVTLAGGNSLARCGLMHLANAGLPELVAQTEEQYVDIAVALANDSQRLTGYRAGMRDRLRASPLQDYAGLTRALEGELRGMWRRWCAGRTSRSGGAK